MKVLTHKTDHLGDWVLSLPALWELRQNFGDRLEHHLLVRPPNVEWQAILPWLGVLHAVHHPRYRRGEVDKIWRSTLDSFRTACQLRRVGFDWGIDLVSTRNDLLGKLLLKAAGCARLSGPDGAHSWLLHERHVESPGHQTSILASRFPLAWGITGTALPQEWMPDSLRWKGGSALLLAPFAGTPAKGWKPERWLELYHTLVPQHEVELLVPAPDALRHQAFLSRFPPSSIRVVSSIRETLEILARARLVVVLDTAVAHYAWAVGAPFVQLFAATTESTRWAPPEGGVTLEEKPSCYPCHREVCHRLTHECMDALTVTRVMEAVRREMAT
ncbi:MAG: glycosyltransferase family 9 protein [Candidatus Methylacidiphilales bacterium]